MVCAANHVVSPIVTAIKVGYGLSSGFGTRCMLKKNLEGQVANYAYGREAAAMNRLAVS
jgi:hypothetical protein